MTDSAATIRKETARFRETQIENALAQIVRRRWPANTVENVAAEWGLTKGRAANVVYAHASMASLNLIVAHRRGRWPIVIAIFQQVIKTSLQAWVSAEVRSLEQTSRIAAAEAQRLGELERGLDRIALRGLGRGQGRKLDRSTVPVATPGRNDRAPLGRTDT